MRLIGLIKHTRSARTLQHCRSGCALTQHLCCAFHAPLLIHVHNLCGGVYALMWFGVWRSLLVRCAESTSSSTALTITHKHTKTLREASCHRHRVAVICVCRRRVRGYLDSVSACERKQMHLHYSISIMCAWVSRKTNRTNRAQVKIFMFTSKTDDGDDDGKKGQKSRRIRTTQQRAHSTQRAEKRPFVACASYLRAFYASTCDGVVM